MATFAIVGATGLIGEPIAKAILRLGHTARVITRGRTPSNATTLDQLQQSGAEIHCGAPDDIPWMTKTLTGCDAVICAMGEGAIYGQVEYAILEAALAAGVKRFVPNEFGLDTLRLPMGTGALFDEKKKFQARLRSSGMPFTVIFNGGIFDFILPNLRFYEGITTFGNDLDVPYYTHSREDIATLTVKAALDVRCINQFVHLTETRTTQRAVLGMLEHLYPENDFPKAHMSYEAICDGTHEVKKAIWIDGHAGELDPRCLEAGELFPEHTFVTVEQALRDKGFFGASREPTTG